MIIPPQSAYFTIGNFNIYFYGVIIAFAIVVALCVLNKILIFNKYVQFDDVLNLFPWLILSGILGARLYYVFINFSYYQNHFLEVFCVWNGGLSIHGAIIGGILALLVFCKKYNFLFSAYLDMFAIVLPLSQAIGRFGNFFNQEAFGKPCNYMWCMFIDENKRPLEYKNNNYFHPTFLYEAIIDFAIFILLLYLLKKYNNLKNGTLCCLYLILYSLGRICVEMIRIDANVFVMGIQLPVIVSFLIIIIASTTLFYINYSK